MSIRNSLITIALIAVATFTLTDYFAERKDAGDIKCNDPQLKEIIMCWEEDIKSMGLDPSKSLGRLRSLNVIDTDDFAGVCNKNSRQIMISKKQLESGYWSTRATVYHELGHWSFCLNHGDCGIMNSRTHTEEYYRDNWDLLVKEYLDKCYGRRFESF